MKKIVTVCSAGLVRSVGLADVLKMHFEPVDVVPVGIDHNHSVLPLLFDWADAIIVMHEPHCKRIPDAHQHKMHLCEVGSDTYHSSRHRDLIDKTWRWARENADLLGIREHTRKV